MSCKKDVEVVEMLIETLVGASVVSLFILNRSKAQKKRREANDRYNWYRPGI